MSLFGALRFEKLLADRLSAGDFNTAHLPYNYVYMLNGTGFWNFLRFFEIIFNINCKFSSTKIHGPINILGIHAESVIAGIGITVFFFYFVSMTNFKVVEIRIFGYSDHSTGRESSSRDPKNPRPAPDFWTEKASCPYHRGRRIPINDTITISLPCNIYYWFHPETVETLVLIAFILHRYITINVYTPHAWRDYILHSRPYEKCNISRLRYYSDEIIVTIQCVYTVRIAVRGRPRVFFFSLSSEDWKDVYDYTHSDAAVEVFLRRRHVVRGPGCIRDYRVF